MPKWIVNIFTINLNKKKQHIRRMLVNRLWVEKKCSRRKKNVWIETRPVLYLFDGTCKNNIVNEVIERSDYGNEIAVSAQMGLASNKNNYQKFAHEYLMEFKMKLCSNRCTLCFGLEKFPRTKWH